MVAPTTLVLPGAAYPAPPYYYPPAIRHGDPVDSASGMSIWVSGTGGRRTIIHHLRNLLRQLEAGDCGRAQAEHSRKIPPEGGCGWMEVCGVAERGHAPTR